jgi:hypothetical protein
MCHPILYEFNVLHTQCQHLLFLVILIIAIVTALRYVIVVLFTFPWWLVMLNVFVICLACVCILCRNVYSDLHLILLKLDYLFIFAIELFELLIYSGH